MEILSGNPSTPLTIPFYTDSSAALAITTNEKQTKRTRHIDLRYFYSCQAQSSGLISTHHVKGDEFQLADIGTKNLPSSVLFPKDNILVLPDSNPI